MDYQHLEAGEELDGLVLARVMKGAVPAKGDRFSAFGPANEAMINHLRERGFEYRVQNKGLRPPWVAWFGRDGKAWEAASRTQFAANCIAAIMAADYLEGLVTSDE